MERSDTGSSLKRDGRSRLVGHHWLHVARQQHRLLLGCEDARGCHRGLPRGHREQAGDPSRAEGFGGGRRPWRRRIRGRRRSRRGRRHREWKGDGLRDGAADCDRPLAGVPERSEGVVGHVSGGARGCHQVRVLRGHRLLVQVRAMGHARVLRRSDSDLACRGRGARAPRRAPRPTAELCRRDGRGPGPAARQFLRAAGRPRAGPRLRDGGRPSLQPSLVGRRAAAKKQPLRPLLVAVDFLQWIADTSGLGQCPCRRSLVAGSRCHGRG
mmetsp:Transcript_134092/g.428465  ORF Transcript_134092/g.428465 Transcript_134092/m.428465 type:complete len:269 (-) Transcript_134092:963-1769(-)